MNFKRAKFYAGWKFGVDLINMQSYEIRSKEIQHNPIKVC